MGPSGVGKTTILRTIAGLEKIETSSIKLKIIFYLRQKSCWTRKSSVSLSFQENSLFPHYTVEKNIYLGAEAKKQNGKRINPKKIIKLLNIEKILSKYPRKISAGGAQEQL